MAKIYAVAKGRVPGIYSSWADCEAQVKGFNGAKYKSFTSQQDADRYMEENGGESVAAVLQHSGLNVGQGTKTVPGMPALFAEVADLKAKAYEHLDFLSDNGLISESTYVGICREIDHNLDIKESSVRNADVHGSKQVSDHVDIYVDGSYNSATDEYGYGIYMDDGKQQRMGYGRGKCEAGGRNVEGETAAAKKALEYVAVRPDYKSVTVYHDYEGIGKWADHAWKANKTYTNAYQRFVDRIRRNGLDVSFVHVDGHTGNEGNEIVDKLAKVGCGMNLSAADEKFLSKYSSVAGYPKDRCLPDADRPNKYTLIGDYDMREDAGFEL